MKRRLYLFAFVFLLGNIQVATIKADDSTNTLTVQGVVTMMVLGAVGSISANVGHLIWNWLINPELYEGADLVLRVKKIQQQKEEIAFGEQVLSLNPSRLFTFSEEENQGYELLDRELKRSMKEKRQRLAMCEQAHEEHVLNL